MLSSPLSFLLCSPELPHSTTMSPCLLFVFQMSLPVQFQLFFLTFLPFCPTHQVTHPCLPKSWSPLVETLPDSLSPSVSTIVSLALLSMLFFHHNRHFVCHPTMLLRDALIHYYLTIAHFLQVPPAHHIIYLATFFATFIRHPVFIFLLEISVDNCQIHSFPKLHNLGSFPISCSSRVFPHYFLIPY